MTEASHEDHRRAGPSLVADHHAAFRPASQGREVHGRGVLQEMDEAGVDAALIHPPRGWDPDSNALAIEAVRKYPDRFAIMGNFALENPDDRKLIHGWRQQPGMMGLRWPLLSDEHQKWLHEGALEWLWPAAEKEGLPLAMMGGIFLPKFREIAERHPQPEDDPRSLRPEPARPGCAGLHPSRRTGGARQTAECRGQGDRRAALLDRRPIRSATSMTGCIASSTRSGRSGCSGAPTSPGCPAATGNASRSSPRNCRG